ncbi:MAG: glutamyl-tRNA reductase [Rhodospirillales bacterium]|jgi:glutamyl-tRNA reductase|nr:glutamyl-tRNA reductase [Rhodospirillales bacterium]MDP6804499.1 glutamyl-tRNA reductase [Rhodospirillales bacterium]
MGADGDILASFLVVGANHRSSSLAVRERLFVADDGVPAFLDRLRRARIDQAVLLSTGDRVEIAALAADAPAAQDDIIAAFAEHAELAPTEVKGRLYTLGGIDAVRHLFGAAATLDSLIVGEAQVLDQLKARHLIAREAGMIGAELDSMLQAAYSAADRARAETGIGEGPVSLSASAIRVARDLHGALERSAALLVGTGDMGELIAKDLLAAGLGRLVVAHPNEARAEALARALDCHEAPFDALDDALAHADIVLCALGARHYTIAADAVTRALARRRRRPVLFVDAAIPGDVDPDIDSIDGAFRYDLADLERAAMDGRADRRADTEAAWRIVDDAVAEFVRNRGGRVAVPAMLRLRRHFEEMRRRVLAEAPDDAEKATRLLVDRILRAPSETMREIATKPQNERPDAPGGVAWSTVEGVLVRLFRLEDPDTPNDRDGRAEDEENRKEGSA